MKNHLLVGVGILGLAELLVPQVFVRAFTKLAYRGADDAEARAWLTTAARIEGVVLVAIALVGLFKSAQGAAAAADTATNAAANAADGRSGDHETDDSDA